MKHELFQLESTAGVRVDTDMHLTHPHIKKRRSQAPPHSTD